jgi:hypothetical protein
MIAVRDTAMPDDRAQLLAQMVGADVSQWASGAHFDPGVTQRLADVVTAIAPDLSMSRLSLLARYSLWTILVDDEVDDPAADPAVLVQLAARLTTIARMTRPVPARSQLLEAMLAELLGELRSAARAPALATRFTDALCAAIDTGVRHTVLAQQIRDGHARPPTALEYLTVASHHVGYRGFAYALLMLARPTPATAAVQRTDMALTAASRAIRIANDLRSVDRDRAAGRLNILLLPTGGLNAGELARQADRYVRLHGRLLRGVAAADVLRRSLRLAVGVYRDSDLR